MQLATTSRQRSTRTHAGCGTSRTFIGAHTGAHAGAGAGAATGAAGTPGARGVLLGLALLAGTAGAQLLPDEQCLQMQYAPTAQSLGSAVSDLVSGDIDGDGDIDLVSADAYAGTVRALINDGTGLFARQTINAGVTPAAVALADADGDLDLDLFVGSDSGLRWLANDGAGHFTVAASFTLPAGDGAPAGLRLSDLNGDGALDVVLGLNRHPISGGGLTGGVWVALGDGAGHFQPLPTQALGARAVDMTVADFNGDRQLDVAALAGYISASLVSIAYGNGDGTFADITPTFGVGIYAGGIASGDFDGDGDADLATGFKYNLSIRFNDGLGHFTLAQSVGVGAYVKGIAAGDLDHDGDLDLAVTSGGSSALRLVTNDGSGHFAITGSIPASIQCYSVALADTNGDGYLDAWAGDVTNGALFSGGSHCLVARYGQSKPNSLGVQPAMGATGSPSVSGGGFTVLTTGLLPLQPALMLVGLAPLAQPALGGVLLVAPPSFAIALTTGAGSGLPGTSDASVTLPVGGSQLGAAGLGTQLYLQLLSRDPAQPDGTAASLSDGLRFTVAP